MAVITTPKYKKGIMEKIFIAVPAGSGSLTYDCHESIIRNTHYLRDKGIETTPYYHPCHIYIDMARNICVDKFLSSDCDNFIFIDSDVGFEDDAIFKLLQYDKDIVAGAYPYRKDSKSEFPVIIDFSNNNNCKDEETNLVNAMVVPTGFMRIHRRVFEKIILLSEDTLENVYKIQKDNNGIYIFFRTGILFPNDNMWYGEDVAFCMWWKAVGGKIFIEPNINFTHTGFKQFSGNFHKYLIGRSTEKIKE